MERELRLTDEEMHELRIIVNQCVENTRGELRRARRLNYREELKTETHVLDSLRHKVLEACGEPAA